MTDCIIARRGSKKTVTYYVWNRYNRVSTTRYRWNRYNVNSTTTYYWDRYNVVESTVYNWNMLELISEISLQKEFSNETIERTKDSICYMIDSIYSYEDFFILNGEEKIFSELSSGDTFVFEGSNARICYEVTKGSSRVPGSSLNYKINANTYVLSYINYSGEFISTVQSTDRYKYPNNAAYDGYWYQYTGSDTNYYKGTSNGSVSSTNRSDYPDNNHSGNYWYIYDRSSTSYSQGSANGSVTSTNRSQYPDNGRSGSYWYVYSTSSTSYTQGSYIDRVTSTNRNTFPDNSYSGNYWYVYQGTTNETITSQASLNSILSN